MSEEKTIETGEYGFCPEHGCVVEVVKPVGDRLQIRLARAGRELAEKKGIEVDGLIEFWMESVAQAMRISRVNTGNPIVIRHLCQELMASIILIEDQLSTKLGENVDILREATEIVENQLDDWGVENDRSE